MGSLGEGWGALRLVALSSVAARQGGGGAGHRGSKRTKGSVTFRITMNGQNIYTDMLFGEHEKLRLQGHSGSIPRQ